MTSTMGPKIVNNRIYDCQQFGIEFNEHMNGPGMFTTWLWGNVITNCAGGVYGAYNPPIILPHEFKNPGANPNRPQTWYQSANTIGSDTKTH